MKMIFAIIRPEKLDAVVAALNERDVYLMTVSDVRGCGRQRGHTETYRGTEQQIRLLPKVKLEIAVNDNFVEPAMEAIMLAARSHGPNWRRQALRAVAGGLRANSNGRTGNSGHRALVLNRSGGRCFGPPGQARNRDRFWFYSVRRP